MEAPGWAEVEVGKGTQFGNRKLNQRLVKIVTLLAEHPHESVPQACGVWKNTKGTYRFWDNLSVTAMKILEPHIQCTRERAQREQMVLAIQDTTELNFTTHKGTAGLGMLDHPNGRGLKVHSVLCVSGNGVPLGLLHQKVWAREIKSGKKERNPQQRPITEKESYRWLEGQHAAEEELGACVPVLTVGDRESDVFELFAQPRRAGSDLLVRVQAKRRRTLHPAKHLEAAVRGEQPVGTLSVQTPRKNGQPLRQAELTIRKASLEILPPARCRDLSAIGVHVILAEEEHPPQGIDGISWLLLTTFPVASLEDALRSVRYYSYRWLIERFHYVLKSGCGMEQMQLETMSRLQNALATKSIVAWRLLWMTHQARVEPDGPAEQVVTAEEWQVLCASIPRPKNSPPAQPTIREAVRMIAQLGGFLARKHDGEPGVKTLWRGLQRLQDRMTGWHLAQAHSKSSG